MNKLIILVFLLLFLGIDAQVAVDKGNPDPSASVDLGDKNRALKLPRIGLLSNTDVVTVPNPANGLIVYNTNNAPENHVRENAYYYYNQELSKWIGVVDNEYARIELEALKPPVYVGQMFKTDSQQFTVFNGSGVNIIEFPESNTEILVNQNMIERVPGSDTTFKILRTGIYIFEGFATFKFTSNSTTFWTIAIQSGVSDDNDTSVPSSFTIGMRCPFYPFEGNAGFFSTCNFTGAVPLQEGELIRLVAVKKNGSSPTAGQVGDGINYAAGVKVVFFSEEQ